MSIGYEHFIGGSVAQTITIPNKASGLGGGIRGFIPQALITTNNNGGFTNTRFLLKNSWNTNKRNKKYGIIQTPFRVVNNAGDILSREYYSCGGSCQTFQSRPGMFGLKQRFGAIQSNCDTTGIPPSSCNVKYVYDSSDYIRYLKQGAINQNYNALNYGGDKYSASQSQYRAIRRY
jgi:hypothetical protein